MSVKNALRVLVEKKLVPGVSRQASAPASRAQSPSGGRVASVGEKRRHRNAMPRGLVKKEW